LTQERQQNESATRSLTEIRKGTAPGGGDCGGTSSTAGEGRRNREGRPANRAEKPFGEFSDSRRVPLGCADRTLRFGGREISSAGNTIGKSPQETEGAEIP